MYFLFLYVVPICDDPEHINFGIVDRVSLDTIRYTCQIGYEIIGESTRTCRNDLTWGDKEPLCKFAGTGINYINMFTIMYGSGM